MTPWRRFSLFPSPSFAKFAVKRKYLPLGKHNWVFVCLSAAKFHHSMAPWCRVITNPVHCTCRLAARDWLKTKTSVIGNVFFHGCFDTFYVWGQICVHLYWWTHQWLLNRKIWRKHAGSHELTTTASRIHRWMRHKVKWANILKRNGFALM